MPHGLEGRRWIVTAAVKHDQASGSLSAEVPVGRGSAVRRRCARAGIYGGFGKAAQSALTAMQAEIQFW